MRGELNRVEQWTKREVIGAACGDGVIAKKCVNWQSSDHDRGGHLLKKRP